MRPSREDCRSTTAPDLISDFFYSCILVDVTIQTIHKSVRTHTHIYIYVHIYIYIYYTYMSMYVCVYTRNALHAAHKQESPSMKSFPPCRPKGMILTYRQACEARAPVQM